MPHRSPYLSQLFAWLGHGYTHLLIALYLTVVLSLEKEWNFSYSELIELWTVGALLMGLGAPLAGWLGDRWSTPGMMVVFFVGAGSATIGAGLSQSTLGLAVALSALGLFASIYHPVGMSWLMRTALRPGFSVGVFGIFGGVGVASAGVIADLLTNLISWRAAFIIPGAASVATGAALALLRGGGWILDHKVDLKPLADAVPSRRDAMRAFWVLSLTVVCSGLIFSSTQTVMPKLFELRLGEYLTGGVFGAGTLFTVVYLAAGAFQIVGGWFADRFSLRSAYLIFFALQLPLLYLMGSLTGLPVIAVVLLMVLFNSGSQPAENLLLTRYTPQRWRATAFGAKFVLAFGVTPLSVQLVGWIYGESGDFYWLFVILAGLAAAVVLAALLLPSTAPVRLRAQPVAAD